MTEFNYLTNADLYHLEEIQDGIHEAFIANSVAAQRFGLSVSNNGLKTPMGDQTATGKVFEMAVKRSPYNAGASLAAGDNAKFGKVSRSNLVKTLWYMQAIHIPWEIDRLTADLDESREATRDHLTMEERCTSDVIEAGNILLEEIVFTGGNGVLGKVSASLESYSTTEYDGLKVTLTDTVFKRPSQFFPEGLHIGFQDATDVTGSGSMVGLAAYGFVVQEQLSDTEITISKYTTADTDTYSDIILSVASGDFIKRWVCMDIDSTGAVTAAVDGYKRKQYPWGIPYLINDRDPEDWSLAGSDYMYATTKAASAVYVGGYSRDAYSVLKSQVLYGSAARGTKEVLTMDRLSTLAHMCKRRGGTPNALWMGPETATQLEGMLRSMGRMDWAAMMAQKKVKIGNLRVTEVQLDDDTYEVVIDDFAPSYSIYMMDEKSKLVKIPKAGFRFLPGDGGTIFRHQYPNTDKFAALFVGAMEIASENMAGDGVLEDIKHYY